jgi:hypothetical protein
MSSFPSPYRVVGSHARLAALVGAATVASSIVAAVLMAFDSRAPETWLAATPEVLEMAARCDSQRQRIERERCKQVIVTARLAAERKAAQLAQR